MIYYLKCYECKEDFSSTNPNEKYCRSCLRKRSPDEHDTWTSEDDKKEFNAYRKKAKAKGNYN